MRPTRNTEPLCSTTSRRTLGRGDANAPPRGRQCFLETSPGKAAHARSVFPEAQAVRTTTSQGPDGIATSSSQRRGLPGLVLQKECVHLERVADVACEWILAGRPPRTARCWYQDAFQKITAFLGSHLLRRSDSGLGRTRDTRHKGSTCAVLQHPRTYLGRAQQPGPPPPRRNAAREALHSSI